MVQLDRFWKWGDPAAAEATYHPSMADDTAKRNPGRAGIMAAAIAAFVLLVTGPASAATVTVASINFQFQPESRSVNVGDVVRWTFAGEPHTVTSGAPGALDGRFDSGIKDPGGSFQVTFDNAGTFPYFCQIHPEQMVGTIVVQAAATSAPTATPTTQPTATPTTQPTVKPTASPTARATARPTAAPTAAPSEAPTSVPTQKPSVPPTAAAASSPSAAPRSLSPSPALSASPSEGAEVGTSPTPDDLAASGQLDATSILAVAIVVGLLVAGGVAIARRPRAG